MLVGVVLAALLASALLTIAVGRVGAGFLVVASIAWILVNKPVEGPTLLPLSHGHGVTVADMASLAGFVLAAWAFAIPRGH